MYSYEPKGRASQIMPKSKINSKKSQNMPRPTVVESKIVNRENGLTIPIQINQPNLSKSKFTLQRNPKDPPAALNPKQRPVTKRENRKPEIGAKSNIPVTSHNKSKAVSRVLMTSSSSLNKKQAKRKNQLAPSEGENLNKELVQENLRDIAEMAIQTNEQEILNHALIVGDLKIVVPSKALTDEIDKLRKEMETKKLLKATRKFEEHSLRDEQHLDDLKEFLDKSYVTRKSPKFSDSDLEEDRRIIASMDDLLQRERPKTESITDIRSRIKHKEQELLSLFDHSQKKTEFFGKINAL